MPVSALLLLGIAVSAAAGIPTGPPSELGCAQHDLPSTCAVAFASGGYCVWDDAWRVCRAMTCDDLFFPDLVDHVNADLANWPGGPCELRDFPAEINKARAWGRSVAQENVACVSRESGMCRHRDDDSYHQECEWCEVTESCYPAAAGVPCGSFAAPGGCRTNPACEWMSRDSQGNERGFAQCRLRREAFPWVFA